MFCSKCGEKMTEGSKFCGKCGAEMYVSQNVKRCDSCGAEMGAASDICPVCGVRAGQDAAAASASLPKGNMLHSFKLISMYDGEPTLGISKASGTLTVYDDRLEFTKTYGNAAVASFGLVGMMLSRNEAKKDKVVIYPLSQIKEFRVGKYSGGVYNTLVVVTSDGAVTSFVPAAPGSSVPQQIINILRPYM